MLFECLLCQVWVIVVGEVLLVYVCQVLVSVCYLCVDVVVVSGEVCGLLVIGQIFLLIDIDVVVMLVVFQCVYLQVEFQLCVDKSEDLIVQVQLCVLDVVLVGLVFLVVLDGVCYQVLQEEDLVVVLVLLYWLVGCKWLLLIVLQDEVLVDFLCGIGVCWQIDDVFVVVGLLYMVCFEVNLMELVECFVCYGLVVGIVLVLIVDGFQGVVQILLQLILIWCVYLVWQCLLILVVWVFVDVVFSCVGVGLGF